MAGAFIVPLALFFRLGFYEYARGRALVGPTLSTWRQVLWDPFYLTVIRDTFSMAALVTLGALALGYPAAYALCSLRWGRAREWLLLTILSPLLVSVVVRAYGWLVLLSEHGVVNWLLMRLGVAREPLQLMFNLTGVVVSLVHVVLPFSVLPIYSVLTQLDPSLKEAAMDLGATPWRAFWRLTLPLSLEGVSAAAQITFTLALGSFVSPALLGGGRVLVLPTMIYQDVSSIAWPTASVEGTILMAMALAAVGLFAWATRARAVWAR